MRVNKAFSALLLGPCCIWSEATGSELSSAIRSSWSATKEQPRKNIGTRGLKKDKSKKNDRKHSTIEEDRSEALFQEVVGDDLSNGAKNNDKKQKDNGRVVDFQGEDDYEEQEEKTGKAVDNKKEKNNKNDKEKNNKNKKDKDDNGDEYDADGYDVGTEAESASSPVEGIMNWFNSFDWNQLLKPCQFLEDQFAIDVVCEVDFLIPLLLARQIKFRVKTANEICGTGPYGNQVCSTPTFEAVVDFDDTLVSSGVVFKGVTIGETSLGDVSFTSSLCIGGTRQRELLGFDHMFEDESYSFGTDWIKGTGESTSGLRGRDGVRDSKMRDYGTRLSSSSVPEENEASTSNLIMVDTVTATSEEENAYLFDPVGPFRSCGCQVKIGGYACKACGPCSGGGFVFDCSNVVPYLKVEAGTCATVATITSLEGSVVDAKIPSFLLDIDPSQLL